MDGSRLAVGGVLLAGASRLAAQGISFSPNVGVYIPTTELVKAANGEEFKQEMSITLGGRLGVALSERLGLEFTGAYAPSDLKITATGWAIKARTRTSSPAAGASATS